MEPNDIEDNIASHAASLGVSVAKLKAIYARGVKECIDQGYDGSPSIYGMARVQRFVVATQSGNYRLTPDSDFAPSKIENQELVSYEITAKNINGWDLIYDMMSANGAKVADTFPPGSVEQTIYDKDTHDLSVLGTHDDVQWVCTLNLSTGESAFVTSLD